MPQSAADTSSTAQDIPVRVIQPNRPEHVPTAQTVPAPALQASPAPAPEPQAEQQGADQAPSANKTLEGWVDADPQWRTQEVLAFRDDAFKLGATVDDEGNLTHLLEVNGHFFLLYLDASFPRPRLGKYIPVRLYLVTPSYDDYPVPLSRGGFHVLKDATGQQFVRDTNFEYDYECHMQRRTGKPMAQAALDLARRVVDWSTKVAPPRDRAATGRGVLPSPSRNLGTVQTRTNQQPMSTRISATGRTNRALRLAPSQFVDGRASLGYAPPRGCKKIVFSNRAFAQIYTETQARITTETGGLLMGHFDNDIWYVIETCDPGWRGVFKSAYHEGDEQYENHIAAVTARLYKYPLVFLGMWHRHPGSLDTFSGTDDITNWGYVDSCAAPGCISGLINYDPEFRMTFYYCEQQRDRMLYSKIDIEVGDERFARPELLTMASKQDVDQRTWR